MNNYEVKIEIRKVHTLNFTCRSVNEVWNQIKEKNVDELKNDAENVGDLRDLQVKVKDVTRTD